MNIKALDGYMQWARQFLPTDLPPIPIDGAVRNLYNSHHLKSFGDRELARLSDWHCPYCDDLRLRIERIAEHLGTNGEDEYRHYRCANCGGEWGVVMPNKIRLSFYVERIRDPKYIPKR